MSKRKKKKFRASPSGSSLLPEGRLSPDDPALALEWWKEAVDAGFDPQAASADITRCLKRASGQAQTRAFQALSKLCAGPLESRLILPEAPQAPLAAVVDKAGGRLFVSGAQDGGLACLDLEGGKTLWQAGSERFRRATGLALEDGTLLVCDSWQKRLSALSAASGELLWESSQTLRGQKLAGPWGLALAGKGRDREIWVADREAHRICRFNLSGACLGLIGRRGMQIEETIARFTGAEQEQEALFFEFPQTLDCVRDLDGRESVFVWDWWNNRVSCLDTAGRLKRQIYLETRQSPAGRFTGQVRVLQGARGPLIAGIDDTTASLILWSHEGDLLLHFRLRETLFGSGSNFECARIASTPGADSAGAFLLTSRGELAALRADLLDQEFLLGNLAILRPEDPRLALACHETGADRADILRASLCETETASLPAGPLASRLLESRDALSGTLERNLHRLEALAEDFRSRGGCSGPQELDADILRRLSQLSDEALERLSGQARPEDGKENDWSEALTELDLALFQNSGNNSREEIKLDHILEEIRDHPDILRRSAWEFRTLQRLLLQRLSGAAKLKSILLLACTAENFLNERLETLHSLEQGLDFRREPQHILGAELKLLHLSLLRLKALEQVSAHLAEELLFRLSQPEIPASPALCETLERCRRVGSRLPHWDELYLKIESVVPPPGHSAQPAPENSGGRVGQKECLKTMGKMVENMEAYLAQVSEKTSLNGRFGKVVSRQKEIFAAKASVLSNRLSARSKNSPAALNLLQKAASLAGESWKSTESLRLEISDNGAAG